MASKRAPPPHLHNPLPGPGHVHPDPYTSAIRPPHGGFPPFEMLPPHEVMAHKLSAQHIEIEKLVTENKRLAATHGTLRQDLAAAKHDLQLIHAHIADVKSEKEQQMRAIVDKMSIMDSELKAAETIKTELQQARAEAQSLVATRQELISKAQQLTHDLQMAHSDAQKIPPLMAELDSLRQEYQHCRATYDYEKKLYNDHLESLQVMEQNYMAMSREVEKLRAELTNAASFDPRTGGPYGGSAGYNESAPMGNYASGQNAYGVGQHGQVPIVGGASGGGPAVPAGTGGNSPHVAAQSAPYASGNARDASRAAVYNASRGTAYDPQRGHVAASYDPQRLQTGPSYDAQRGPTAYDAQRGPTAYDAQRGPTASAHYTHNTYVQNAPAYDMQRSSGDEVQRVGNYDQQIGASYGASSSRGVGPQGQVSVNNVPYGSTPNTKAGTGYESVPQGENPVRR